MATILKLASASPRRAELLRQIGVPFEVVSVDVDESVQPAEAPRDYVERLARAKAQTAMRAGHALVLAADTTVVCQGRIFGKPAHEEQALSMLQALSARTHSVLTAVALGVAGSLHVAVSRSEVTFRSISPAEARRYWHTGEPRDKAGGYAIQGLGAVFVSTLSGSYSGVMGLPLSETAALLDAAGLDRWCLPPPAA